eukprot:scaffold33374_cov47-Cyclotella_meneghiniana.AAC.2
MPSKKKAKARARKTARANQAVDLESNIRSPNQFTCDHDTICIPPNCIDKSKFKQDLNACGAFLAEYDDNFFVPNREIILSIEIDNHGDHSYVRLVSNFFSYMSLKYDKYFFGDDSREEALREIFLRKGTDHTLKMIGDDAVLRGYVFAPMGILPLVYLEMQHRAFNDIYEMEAELQRVMADIMHCPRQIVRFFHRRNSCDCLKKIYYELKDTTKRTAACFECGEVKDIRTLYRCSGCNVAQFCSNECAASHWPKHKKDCRRWGKCNNSGDSLIKID